MARILRRALTEGAEVTSFDAPFTAPFPGSRTRSDMQTAIVGASPLSMPDGSASGAVLHIRTAGVLSRAVREEREAGNVEELQTLAWGLAHEIKNPLGGILGAAQWILRTGVPADEREEGIRLVLREAGRINALVEKMLEMGRTPPAPRPFSVLPLISDARALVMAEARNAGKEIAVELHLDPSLPDVSGHADSVYQAILNILLNASEAIPGKGVVEVHARMNANLKMRPARGRRRSLLEIVVTDDGPGMSAESARKALLPFFTTKPKGTGLGLALVRQTVTRHGGTVSISSEEGKGTTVSIQLPVTQSGGRR